MIIGIETATPVCSVGLVDGQTDLGVLSEEAGRRHSVVVAEMVDRVIADAGRDKSSLEGVAISAGPGSFTGLRIGMGLAKGISMAMDLPLAVVSTLHALAHASSSTSNTVCACLDARHGELYAGVYERIDGELAESVGDAGRPVEDLINALVPDTDVVGYDIEPYERQLLDAGFRVAPNVVPTGLAVARVGDKKLRAGRSTPLDLAEPNYCKKSQAERIQAGEKT